MKRLLPLLALAPLCLIACSGDSADAPNAPAVDSGSQPQNDAAPESSTDSATTKDSATDTGKDSTTEVDAQPDVADSQADSTADSSEDAAVDSEVDSGSDANQDADAQIPTSCNFDYDTAFQATPPPMLAPFSLSPVQEIEVQAPVGTLAEIAHADPAPSSTYKFFPPNGLLPIIMPNYTDNMPLFARSAAWTSATRCYETPSGVKLLTEAEAYNLYAFIAEENTGVAPIKTSGVRSVVGIRGSYPGRFAWHGNAPNRFNDTLALLWIDGATKHVREFPVNTDTGDYNFGADSSSSLRANRRYHHVNGTHNTYDALRINETAYRVRDDTNTNGHYDSDRNGWLAPIATKDHDRTGSGHNIHMGAVDAPLGTAKVNNWSAGCQVIPGMANWTEFINNAWTKTGDAVNYFLIDARDIPPDVWEACIPDGSHKCPFRVEAFPFTVTGDTSKLPAGTFNGYNCSTANESGAEAEYVIRVDKQGTLTVSVDCAAPVDIDVQLLEGDDSKACLIRNDKTFTYDLAPGRYIIVADTFTKQSGEVLSGAYTLSINFK